MNFSRKQEEKLINDIKDYLIKNYPDSLIAANDLSGDFYETVYHVSYFFYAELIGMCGCGCMGSTIEAVVDYLNIVWIREQEEHGGYDKANALTKEKFGNSDVCSIPLLQFMAYVLDNLGLTDHGVGIGAAWITDLGKMCWFALHLYLKYSEECEKFP